MSDKTGNRVNVALTADAFEMLKKLCQITLRSSPKQLEYMLARELKLIDESENDPKDA